MDIIESVRKDWKKFREERALMKEKEEKRKAFQEESERGLNFKRTLDSKIEELEKTKSNVLRKPNKKGGVDVTVTNATIPAIPDGHITSIHQLVQHQKPKK